MKESPTREDDFVEKVSLNLVKSYDLIAFEVKNHCPARHITDAAWNKLITATSTRQDGPVNALNRGDPSNTSQVCSICVKWS